MILLLLMDTQQQIIKLKCGLRYLHYSTRDAQRGACPVPNQTAVTVTTKLWCIIKHNRNQSSRSVLRSECRTGSSSTWQQRKPRSRSRGTRRYSDTWHCLHTQVEVAGCTLRTLAAVRSTGPVLRKGCLRRVCHILPGSRPVLRRVAGPDNTVRSCEAYLIYYICNCIIAKS